MKRKIFWVHGLALSSEMRDAARARYIYRHTRETVPNHVLPIHHYWNEGGLWTHYFEAKPQFTTDQEWLDGCEFPMANVDGTEFAPCWHQPRKVGP